jgi:hypothetical protein
MEEEEAKKKSKRKGGNWPTTALHPIPPFLPCSAVWKKSRSYLRLRDMIGPLGPFRQEVCALQFARIGGFRGVVVLVAKARRGLFSVLTALAPLLGMEFLCW